MRLSPPQLLTGLGEIVYNQFAAPPPRGPTTEGSPVNALSPNDRRILHALMLRRLNCVLGVASLLKSSLQTDEELEAVDAAISHAQSAKALLKGVCVDGYQDKTQLPLF